MNTKLWSITHSDVIQSLWTSMFASVSTTFLTAVTLALQGIVANLQTGQFNIDFKSIAISLLVSLAVGVATGLMAFVGSLSKRFSTDENGKIGGKFLASPKK